MKMAQVIDFQAAAKAKQAQRSLLVFPEFKPARTKRARIADRRTAVRMAAKERL
jgi:hypothetical protein